MYNNNVIHYMNIIYIIHDYMHMCTATENSKLNNYIIFYNIILAYIILYIYDIVCIIILCTKYHLRNNYSL